MGRDARKPDFVVYELQRRRSDCASAQSDQCLCYSSQAKFGIGISKLALNIISRF